MWAATAASFNPLRCNSGSDWLSIRSMCATRPLRSRCVDQLTLAGPMQRCQRRNKCLLLLAARCKPFWRDVVFRLARLALPALENHGRVEVRSPFQPQIRAGMAIAQGWKSEETSEYLPRHAKQYVEWMDDASPLSISKTWLNRLTEIALYSPAVCLVRAFMSVFTDSKVDTWADLLA